MREKAAINAELAGEERPAFSLTGALEVFLVETGDRRAGMSAAQVKKWEAPQRRAVDEFVALRGDKPLAEFRPDIAVAFRTMRRQRLENGKAVPKTAKRSIGHRSDRFKSVVEMR